MNTIVPCEADQWTLIAEDWKQGRVRINSENPREYYIYVAPTGNTAPTERKLVGMRLSEVGYDFQYRTGSDIYIYPIDADGEILLSDDAPYTDTFLQDQFSTLVDRFLTRTFQSVTTAATTTFRSKTIVLEAGHGFGTSGFSEMIEINYNGQQYQSRVLSVATNTITVTNPIPWEIPAATEGARTSPDCNVNGSTTPVVFSTQPPPGVKWDINILSVNMLDQTAMDDSTFGGIEAPITGVIYETINTTRSEHILTAVDNSCFIRHCDTENPYSNKAPAGYYGFNAKRRFNGQQGDGVSRRIGEEFHKFQVTVTADLRGLDRYWNVIRGHVVE